MTVPARRTGRPPGSRLGPDVEPDDAVFAALADPTRRRMLAMLSHGGPRTATELTAEFPVSRQALAKHLQALHRAGLVAPERQGREARYTATPAPLGDVIRWVTDVGGRWDARLARLRTLLEDRGGDPT